jgi:ABC-type transport system involved in cytochrome c biogenesis permease subunit
MGQVLVAFFGVTFLPPMSEWYSALITYPVLLPIQIVILFLQTKISLDIWGGVGFFARRRPRAGRALCWFSYVYFLAMVVRYVLTMYLYPERRWLSGTIPIFFHWVLATYVFVLGRYYLSADREQSAPHGRG